MRSLVCLVMDANELPVLDTRPLLPLAHSLVALSAASNRIEVRAPCPALPFPSVPITSTPYSGRTICF